MCGVPGIKSSCVKKSSLAMMPVGDGGKKSYGKENLTGKSD